MIETTKPEFAPLRACSDHEEIADWIKDNAALFFKNAYPSRPIPQDFAFKKVRVRLCAIGRVPPMQKTSDGRWEWSAGWSGSLVVYLPAEIHCDWTMFLGTGLGIGSKVVDHSMSDRQPGWAIHEWSITLLRDEWPSMAVREKLLNNV